MFSSVQKNSLTLAAFALVATLLLGGTFLNTQEDIAYSERKAAQKALFEIVPNEDHDNDLLNDTLPVPESYWAMLGLKAGGDIHIARRQGKPIAVIIPAVAPDGYSGDIKLIVGINLTGPEEGTVAGARVLAHAETPGLGDKIDLKKDDWILSFDGKSLKNPSPSRWKVAKDQGDFDQFTGATITPRAVVKQVFNTLKYHKEDSARLLQQAGSPTIKPDKESDNE